MRDYRWIAVGGGFGPEDDLASIERLMDNMWVAGRFLDQQVDGRQWLRPARAEAVFLVLRQAAGLDFPDIEEVGREPDGVLMYMAKYDWLTPAHLDKDSGPWQVTAVLMLILVTISEGIDAPLPALPTGALGS